MNGGREFGKKKVPIRSQKAISEAYTSKEALAEDETCKLSPE